MRGIEKKLANFFFSFLLSVLDHSENKLMLFLYNTASIEWVDEKRRASPSSQRKMDESVHRRLIPCDGNVPSS